VPIIISLQNVLTKLSQKQSGAVFLPHSVDCPDRSRNATCARGEESKKTKKKEKKLRDLTSRVCAQTMPT